jgi:hypothetical protein
MDKSKVTELLLQGAPANVVGPWVETAAWRESGRGNVVAHMIGADATGAATVQIEGAQVGVATAGVAIGAAMALTQAAPAKAQAIDYPWPYLRAVVSGVAANATSLRVSLAQ